MSSGWAGGVTSPECLGGTRSEWAIWKNRAGGSSASASGKEWGRPAILNPKTLACRCGTGHLVLDQTHNGRHYGAAHAAADQVTGDAARAARPATSMRGSHAAQRRQKHPE